MTDLVITPGGPRPGKNVHEVRGSQVVFRQDTGNHNVIELQDVASLRDQALVTPGGPRLSSQIHHIEPDQVVNFGQRREGVAAVQTPVRSKSMSAVAESTSASPGWVAYAYWSNNSGSPITRFSTTWTVPPPPARNSGQLIYLFNGIENFGSNPGILQPVLQWGQSPLGGGGFWAIASWYVLADNTAYKSKLVAVSPGQTLVGTMTLTSNGNGLCDYTSQFEGLPDTLLNIANIPELMWCNETLEAYTIAACSDYPAGQVNFSSIQVETGSGTPALAWTAADRVTNCGQHVAVVSNSPVGGEVDIVFQ